MKLLTLLHLPSHLLYLYLNHHNKITFKDMRQSITLFKSQHIFGFWNWNLVQLQVIKSPFSMAKKNYLIWVANSTNQTYCQTPMSYPCQRRYWRRGFEFQQMLGLYFFRPWLEYLFSLGLSSAVKGRVNIDLKFVRVENLSRIYAL